MSLHPQFYWRSWQPDTTLFTPTSNASVNLKRVCVFCVYICECVGNARGDEVIEAQEKQHSNSHSGIQTHAHLFNVHVRPVWRLYDQRKHPATNRICLLGCTVVKPQTCSQGPVYPPCKTTCNFGHWTRVNSLCRFIAALAEGNEVSGFIYCIA